RNSRRVGEAEPFAVMRNSHGCGRQINKQRGLSSINGNAVNNPSARLCRDVIHHLARRLTLGNEILIPVSKLFQVSVFNLQPPDTDLVLLATSRENSVATISAHAKIFSVAVVGENAASSTSIGSPQSKFKTSTYSENFSIRRPIERADFFPAARDLASLRGGCWRPCRGHFPNLG